MKALCVFCLKRPGDPKNGGLCYTCGPRIKVHVGREHGHHPRNRIRVHQAGRAA